MIYDLQYCAMYDDVCTKKKRSSKTDRKFEMPKCTYIHYTTVLW